MRKNKDQLKVGALLSYINLAIGSIIPLVYTPVMLRILGQSEYGLYSLSSSIIAYLSLLSFGLGGTIIRYISLYRVNNEKDKEEAAFGFFLAIYLVIAVIIFTVGIVLSYNAKTIFKRGLSGSEIEKIRILMIIMAFNTAISFPISVFSSVVMAHERYIYRKLVDMFCTVAAPVSNLILLYLGFGSVGMALTSTGIQFTVLPLNMLYCFKQLHVFPRFRKLPIELIKEILGFSVYVFIGSIVDMLFWATDKVILGMLASSIAVAVYNIGCTFNTIVTSLSGAISNLLAPRVTGMVARGCKTEELSALFIKVGRIQFSVLGLIISGFLVFGQEFLLLWAGDNYSQSYWIAVFTLVPLCIPLIQNTGISIVMAQNKHKFRSIVYLIIAVINVLSTYLIVPYLGGVGAALCSGISYILGQGIIMNIYYYKVIKIDVVSFWSNIGKMSVTPVILMILTVFLKRFVSFNRWVTFFCGVVVYTVMYICGQFILALNEDEKKLIMLPIKKFVFKHKI